MNEHSFARKLSTALRNAGAYVWKINANFAGGVPDMWVAGNGTDAWLELKWGKLPVRDRTTINLGLSAQQLLWLQQRHLQGVRVAVVWGCPDGVLILDNPSDWTGLVVGRAKTLLNPFRLAITHICHMIGIGAPENASPRTQPADTGAARHSHPPKKFVASKARRAWDHANPTRRTHGNHPRRVDPVSEPAHCGPHRLCSGLLPRAGH